MSRKGAAGVAEHRPATQQRRNKHDVMTAVDLFSGFGGLTAAAEAAGFLAITAANHNRYKVQIHEANNPHVEHWIADLVDTESPDYHDVRDLPAADLLVAGVSCVNHSQANTKKAYAQGLSLFDLDDPEFDERVTRSERDRATANCVLHYAAQHHPRMILVECTTELVSWGPALSGRAKVGDGSTYRWWLNEFTKLNYSYRVLYLNSQFFGVPQSRDRIYIVMWDRRIPAPDLDHRPVAQCGNCDDIVESVWTWRTGVPPTGSVRYGKQYDYRCPRCRARVFPASTPSLAALDLSNLGTRIGDKPIKKFYNKEKEYIGSGPMAPATMARAARCWEKFREFPAVLMPAKATHGSERHIWQPMNTQTSQQETALLSTGAVIAAHKHNGDGQHIGQPMDTVTTTHEKALVLSPTVALAVDNYQGIPRGGDEPLPTQGGSETMALVTAGVVPFRRNTLPSMHTEPMPTFTSDQIPGLLTAAGMIKNNGPIDQAKYRTYGLDEPLGTVVGSAANQGMLFSGWYKQNGSTGTETAPHPMTDPFGTLTSRDTTALLMAQWQAALADIALEDCFFRMLTKHETGRGCGFDVDFPGYKGSFIVWGTARDQVDGFGNAVSPQVGEWICRRLRAVLHSEVAA